MGAESLKTKKLAFLLFSFMTLSGCIEATALLGPAITVSSTGNVYQASLSYASNKIIYDTTGKSSMDHFAKFLDPNDAHKGEIELILKDKIKDVKDLLKHP